MSSSLLLLMSLLYLGSHGDYQQEASPGDKILVDYTTGAAEFEQLASRLPEKFIIDPEQYNRFWEQQTHILPPDSFLKLKMCRNGLFLYNKNDIYTGRSMDLYGEWSEDEVKLFGTILKPGYHVVDVGAHIGVFTIPMAKMVGPTGRVYAIEPQRILFQLLNSNVALNGLKNVYTIRGAVGDSNEQIFVPDFDPNLVHNYGGISLLESWKTVSPVEEAELIMLDKLELRKCDFLKVEGKGMELKILRGAKAIITSNRPIIYVESDRKETHKGLVKFIHSLGYECVWIISPLFREANFFGNEENVFGNTGSFNMLCSEKESTQLSNWLAIYPKVELNSHPLFGNKRF